MKVAITLTYGDDKKERFVATDFPSTGDFIVIYTGLDRTYIKQNSVIRMETKVLKK